MEQIEDGLGASYVRIFLEKIDILSIGRAHPLQWGLVIAS